MRKIAVVTVGRSDYGVYRPLLRRLQSAPAFELQLIVAGAHLSPAFGRTRDEITADGFPIAAAIDTSPISDTPADIARAMGHATAALAATYDTLRPDILVVLGDRLDMHAATVAAVPFLIPIAHIGGGAITGGAIDDSFRHSITKLANLHFVETDAHAQQLARMGEVSHRVHVTGALGLDNLTGFTADPIATLNEKFELGLEPGAAPLLVTFHPVTREFERTHEYMRELSAALAEFDQPIVFTYPNADTAGRTIIDAIDAFIGEHERARAVPHLGTHGYFSMMTHAAAMVGNSSSGIIEAASFRLPVVDIGDRQAGRLAPANVIHVEPTRDAIAAGIRRATDPRFRTGLASLVNPHGDGNAAERMVDVLAAIDVNDPALIRKDG